MASPRRIGAPDAKNRAVLIDAAERLLLEEGHTAVSSRRVAARAGLKPQLVHYYFRTMEDLFLAVFRRRAEEGLEQQAKALESDQPLWALWRFSVDPRGIAMAMAFTGLAGQSETIRAEVADYSERFRAAQIEALTEILDRYEISADAPSPAALVVLLTSVSRVVMLEEALGVTTGHAEALALVEHHIRALEGPPSLRSAG
ncbi:TetR/AcrR family transcriptional regulator [Actinocorallia populi]|uniref:TetR/AcrR family transcriptional regulator n=1 Tax=Actinocorallia populi TaxID=2079200 RepID=UPI000D095A88|nr:TetR/AcrR family transcriptional regulator [Actinocorallia populi]